MFEIGGGAFWCPTFFPTKGKKSKNDPSYASHPVSYLGGFIISKKTKDTHFET